MSVEENMALARRFLEARGRADLDALEDMMAHDFVDHTLAPGQEPDREGYKRLVAEYVSAFSDVRFVIEDQVAAGDKVVSRISAHGIHDRKEVFGVAPTGREMATTAILIHRISGGKIAEEWDAATGISELRGERLEQEARERERLEQELRVARRIQHALLPEATPQLDGWKITQYYQPAREVGGDFYDFLRLQDSRVGLVIGDVSGKGIPAAVLMANTQSVLRTVAQRGSAPGQALMEANEVLCAYVPPNMFITCLYSILEPESGRLVYANAGHNLPCCQRHNGRVDELRATGMPLGLMPGMGYEEKETILAPGDSTLFYSDGLVEAHDPKGQMFGFPRLRELVAEHGEKRSLGNLLLEELYSFVGEGWEQEDDITLLTLRRSASLS
jgi:serine phosphatase RsbU (regulator of sigma subunit)/predicted ester cyclase